MVPRFAQRPVEKGEEIINRHEAHRRTTSGNTSAIISAAVGSLFAKVASTFTIFTSWWCAPGVKGGSTALVGDASGLILSTGAVAGRAEAIAVG